MNDRATPPTPGEIVNRFWAIAANRVDQTYPDLATVQHALTPDELQAFESARNSMVVDELLYRLFRHNARRDPSITPARFCAAFGGDAAAFEARLREEQANAGARIADDRFCPGCGARGFTSLCPSCR